MTPSRLFATTTPTDALARARRLLDVSVALSTIREPDALLGFIIDTATGVMACTDAALLLFDERDGRLRFAAATGEQREALSQIAVPLQGSIAGTIFRENRTIHVTDAQDDDRHFGGADAASGTKTRAILGVPMCIDGRPIGVFEVLNPHAGAFSSDDERTLLVLAAQAAVAIENMRQRRALAAARDRLAELDRLKSDFMALASHELRTPIAIVLGYADILREEAAPGLTGFVDSILEAGGRMHEIVETLEQISVLEGEEAEMELLPVVLQEIVASAWDQVAVPDTLEAALELPPTPVVVRAERARLRLALVNLIKNAAAFTQPGGRLDVRLSVHDGMACVEVQDTGIGLDSSDCARIFEAFYQVADPLTRSHEGMGTGLTVARGLIEAHGGRIWAESDGVGCGTTLHVRLMLHQPAVAAA